MNYLDIAIAAILILTIAINAYRGIIRTVFNALSVLAAFLVSRIFAGPVSKFLMTTSLFADIKEAAASALNLQTASAVSSKAGELDLLNSLPLPQSMVDNLVTNNNPEAYLILKVSNFQEYISTYIASVVVYAIAAVGIFLLALLALSIAAMVLDLAAKLPVIRTFNRLLGGCLGLVLGLINVFILLSVVTLFASAEPASELSATLHSSALASMLNSYNFILRLLADIF